MEKVKIGEFIQKYLHENGISQNQFAIKCGFSGSYIGQLIRGINPKTGRPIEPTIEAYRSIAEAMDISVQELFEKIENAPIEIYKNSKGDARIIDIDTIRKHKIPLIGSVAGGEPIYDEEFDVYTDGPLEAVCALRLKGDSMAPKYINGDIIYVKEQPDVRDGQIAVVFLDDECTLKHVYHLPNGIQLVSENPKYKPKTATFEDYVSIRILGVPCGFTRIFGDNQIIL